MFAGRDAFLLQYSQHLLTAFVKQPFTAHPAAVHVNTQRMRRKRFFAQRLYRFIPGIDERGRHTAGHRKIGRHPEPLRHSGAQVLPERGVAKGKIRPVRVRSEGLSDAHAVVNQGALPSKRFADSIPG